MIDDPDIETIRRRMSMGERIAQLRREAGLTQLSLSQLSGLPASDVNNLEQGLVHFSSLVLLSLCRALKIEIIAVFNPHADHVGLYHQSDADRPRSAGPH